MEHCGQIDRPPRPATVERMLRRAKSVDMEDEEVTVGMSPLSANGHAASALMLGGIKDTSTDSSSIACRGTGFHNIDLNGHPNLIDDEIITINVSGMQYQTMDSTLRRFPASILGNPSKRQRYWNSKANEYFFDRHRPSFEAILHIYQTNGQVIRPESVPINLFLRELKFYEFDQEVLSNFWESEGYQKPEEEIMPEGHFQKKIWELMEHPDSSPAARILAFISISVIIISIISFCTETIPELGANDETHREWSSPFFWIEFACCIWFSLELIVRFLSSPSKVTFLKSFLNILDFVAVVPFFVNLIWSSASHSATSHDKSSSVSFSVLRIIRLVRVFRIFKLSRHSVGLQVLGKTFKASIQEFMLLIFFMVIALVLFSSGIYFAEQSDTETKFTSIPASFWFVMATITTVGFGDLVPTTAYGKIVGSICSLIGVLTLALPVPIIVANFKHFYRQECRLAALYTQNLQDMEDLEAMKQQQINVEKLAATTTDFSNSPKQNGSINNNNNSLRARPKAKDGQNGEE